MRGRLSALILGAVGALRASFDDSLATIRTSYSQQSKRLIQAGEAVGRSLGFGVPSAKAKRRARKPFARSRSKYRGSLHARAGRRRVAGKYRQLRGRGARGRA